MATEALPSPANIVYGLNCILIIGITLIAGGGQSRQENASLAKDPTTHPATLMDAAAFSKRYEITMDGTVFFFLLFLLLLLLLSLVFFLRSISIFFSSRPP